MVDGPFKWLDLCNAKVDDLAEPDLESADLAVPLIGKADQILYFLLTTSVIMSSVCVIKTILMTSYLWPFLTWTGKHSMFY